MTSPNTTTPSVRAIAITLIAALLATLSSVQATAATIDNIDQPAEMSTGAQRAAAPIQVAEPPPPPEAPWDMPAHDTTGRRAVYSKSKQWAWTVEADGTISSANPVSGSRVWNLPTVGVHRVSSRSMHTCSLTNPNLCWRFMVRFASGPEAIAGDNIGFHEIPLDRSKDNRPVQTEAQLGRAISAGCVRMATPAAEMMWKWAPLGTTVVVLP